MANSGLNHFGKIVNPDLAITVLHSIDPRGEFKAFVRLAKPEKPSSYMKVMEIHSPGLFKVRIPCDRIMRVANDRNVLSVELYEHISGTHIA
ncbi:MAG: hypothetical protein SFW62_08330 [Alphaproteobacteria bacterium]|nr:hypothetical protein [Alphaproteobacteria bacterium]